MTSAVAMTYDSLAENIQSWLERTDTATVAKIPTFIMLAEQVLASEIKFLGNLTAVTSTTTTGNPVLPKPARWRKTVSMNIVDATGQRQPVFLRKYEYIREYWPDASLTDLPKFYCDYDYDHWLLGPTPSTAYNIEILYYGRVQPLDSSNQTNWFTINAPQALLYGSLTQAMPWLKNDGRIQTIQAQYKMATDALKAEDITRVGDRQTVAADS